ncbi:MAG: hypothetical protein LBB40_05290 [Holophagales bacterium]|jgi:hypothetical protein|nr:hypothetical protein [Holophagales bacterium]
MKPAISSIPDVNTIIDDYLVGIGALAYLVYSNVKPNTKRSDSGIRYSFVKDGDAVGNCAKRLFAHYVEQRQIEKGVEEIKKIGADIGYDTWPTRSFYTLIYPSNRSVAQ